MTSKHVPKIKILPLIFIALAGRISANDSIISLVWEIYFQSIYIYNSKILCVLLFHLSLWMTVSACFCMSVYGIQCQTCEPLLTKQGELVRAWSGEMLRWINRWTDEKYARLHYRSFSIIWRLALTTEAEQIHITKTQGGWSPSEHECWVSVEIWPSVKTWWGPVLVLLQCMQTNNSKMKKRYSRGIKVFGFANRKLYHI